jgi:hypothetical protein
MLHNSPLYLEEGEYFSGNQFVATDGAFEGDGTFFCSCKNPGNDPNKICLTLLSMNYIQGRKIVTKELVLGFQLGNNKCKLPYKEETLILAIKATCWIHKFILNMENLSYSALESPEMYFSIYY